MDLVGYIRRLTLSGAVTKSADAAQVNVSHVDHARTTAAHVVATDAPAAVIVDDAGAGTVYNGRAFPGTAESFAGWQISKTVVAGDLSTTTWATVDPGGGAALSVAQFEHIWDDRASLTYT